jgi:hypothetical protein
MRASARQLRDLRPDALAAGGLNAAITNAFLFKLGFHSDHHMAAARPYPLLRQHDPADVLPAGYSGMILLSLVPPLWRSVMDWRVDRRQLKIGTA